MSEPGEGLLEYLSSNYTYQVDGKVFNRWGREVGSYTQKYGRLGTPFGMVTVHRFLIFAHTGVWAEGFIDHIDGNPHNNALSNLRVCSRAENSRNRNTHSNNKSGYKGVYPQRYGGKIINYLASIQVDNKRIFIGTFKTKELAAIAYNEAASAYHGEFAKLNNILGETECL